MENGHQVMAKPVLGIQPGELKYSIILYIPGIMEWSSILLTCTRNRWVPWHFPWVYSWAITKQWLTVFATVITIYMTCEKIDLKHIKLECYANISSKNACVWAKKVIFYQSAIIIISILNTIWNKSFFSTHLHFNSKT